MPPRWITRSVAVVATTLAAAAVPATATAQTEPLSIGVFVPDAVIPSGGVVDASLTIDANRDVIVDQLVFTFDLSEIAGLATINIDGGSYTCTTNGAAMTCVSDFEEHLFAGGLSLFDLEIFADQGATVGSSGTLGITVDADGASATHDMSVTVGDAVDLDAADRFELTTEPGATLTVPLTVRNDGPAAAQGVALQTFGQYSLRPQTRHSNCLYLSEFTGSLCMFDVVLEPGVTYEFDPPFQLAVGADMFAPSVGVLEAQWLTRAEAAVVVSERSGHGLPVGTPGTGAELALVEAGGGAPAPLPANPVPAGDLDPDNNWTQVDLTVAGDNGSDLAAVGANVPGDVGDTITVRVGVENLGPASRDAGRAGEPVNWLRVTLPGGTSATEVPDACRQDGGADGFLCSTDSLLPVGDSELFEFVLRVDQASTTNGLVAVNRSPDPAGGEPFDDGNPSNDTAEIVVGAGGGGGGLPVTGASVGVIAVAGALLIGVGGTCLLLVRRRRARFEA